MDIRIIKTKQQYRRKNRASKILARKRALTLPMIRSLHDKLGIPSELLIQEPSADYRLTTRRRRKSA